MFGRRCRVQPCRLDHEKRGLLKLLNWSLHPCLRLPLQPVQHQRRHLIWAPTQHCTSMRPLLQGLPHNSWKRQLLSLLSPGQIPAKRSSARPQQVLLSVWKRGYRTHLLFRRRRRSSRAETSTRPSKSAGGRPWLMSWLAAGLRAVPAGAGKPPCRGRCRDMLPAQEIAAMALRPRQTRTSAVTRMHLRRGSCRWPRAATRLHLLLHVAIALGRQLGTPLRHRCHFQGGLLRHRCRGLALHRSCGALRLLGSRHGH